jgi:hypothetical protein
MTVIAHVVLEGVTRDQYDAVRSACGWLEHTPVGGLAHLSWWQGEDNHNVDAWESEEAFAAFGQDRLGPAMAQVGVNVEPRVTFYPAHEVFLPAANTITAS